MSLGKKVLRFPIREDEPLVLYINSPGGDGMYHRNT